MISAESLSKLVGVEFARLEPVTRGGNSRVLKVIDRDGEAYAAKFYPPIDELGRDRLGTEWTALAFLADHGVSNVPRPVSRHDSLRLGLYSWLEGDSVRQGDAPAAAAMLDFVQRLKELRSAPGARGLPMASEACLSLTDVAAQVRRRLARYREIEIAELRAFLDDEIEPLVRRLEEACTVSDTALQPGFLSLSPSDFGLHNAVRRGDGTLGFTDFEYFGWDDPVKLVDDMLWHPGMTLTATARRALIAGAESLFAEDMDFRRRLRRHYPWFGLRWCMILLSEFLPDRRSIRAHAGQEARPEDMQKRQLARARSYAERVRNSLVTMDFEWT